MTTVIEDIFGWRSDLACPTIEQGVFPLVRAFTMAVETDSSQSLHCHSLIWLVADSDPLTRLNDYSKCAKHRVNEPTDGLFGYQKVPDVPVQSAVHLIPDALLEEDQNPIELLRLAASNLLPRILPAESLVYPDDFEAYNSESLIAASVCPSCFD